MIDELKDLNLESLEESHPIYMGGMLMPKGRRLF